MNKSLVFITIGIIIFFNSCNVKEEIISDTPISQHPENPHYFLYKEKPTVLITSGEHYGSLINLDFDYKKYFETLKQDSLNLTRTFSGVYYEDSAFFGIVKNTMAPSPGSYLSPWMEVQQTDGKFKYDLNKWNPQYFKRLHNYVQTADNNDVVIEFVLFCNYYNPELWATSPINPKNNINLDDSIYYKDALTMKHAALIEYQLKFVKKIAGELNSYNNIYYEICNEPYIFDHVEDKWQNLMIDSLVSFEERLPQKHLIAINYANGSERIEELHPAVSLVNFHYSQPKAVHLNYNRQVILGDNETGGRLMDDKIFVQEGWNYIVSGGGLYNNLDYSFSVGHEDGSRKVDMIEPGAGSPKLRKQLKHLRRFMGQFDYIKMAPDTTSILSEISGKDCIALSNTGQEYSVYVSPKRKVSENISILFETQLMPEYSEEYSFTVFSDDGVRIYIDGKRVLDLWKEWGVEGVFKYQLEKGKPVDLRVEYYQKIGSAKLMLNWSSRSQKDETISAGNYFLQDLENNGVKTTYYNGIELGVIIKESIEPTIYYSGGEESKEKEGKSDILRIKLPTGKYRLQKFDIEKGTFYDETIISSLPENNSIATIEVSEEDVAIHIKKIETGLN